MLIHVKRFVFAIVLMAASGLTAQVVSAAASQDESGTSNLTVTTPSATDAGSATPTTNNNSTADGAAPEPVQSFWRRFQVHGTLSQGFIYGSGNNYLSMNTNDGTAKWSEGSINLSYPVTDNFHIGAQVHDYMMGELGRGNVQLDWAYADLRVKDWLGFRGGKLKAPMGIFNEVEDTDTLYNWALLPQGMYESEYRSFNVPVLGGSIYGSFRVPGGSLSYQAFGGKRSIATNDGAPILTWQDYGIALSSDSGYTYGLDLKWQTPLKGFWIGVSGDKTHTVAANSVWTVNPANPFGVPIPLYIEGITTRGIVSLEYDYKKLQLMAEGKDEPHQVINNGIPVQPNGESPRKSWYVMGAYHLTNKLTAGSYFSRVWGTDFIRTFSWAQYSASSPAFYSNDTVANVRYDFNRYFYLKMEGHYISGNLGAFFPDTNPNGLQKVTRLGIARLGFTF